MINQELMKQRIKIEFQKGAKNYNRSIHAIKLPLISSHYLKISTTGKIHIVHRTTGIAICTRKIKFEHEGFTNLSEINETDMCKNCVHFHNQMIKPPFSEENG